MSNVLLPHDFDKPIIGWPECDNCPHLLVCPMEKITEKDQCIINVTESKNARSQV